jgi:tRNA G10  N-methylase Trm11
LPTMPSEVSDAEGLLVLWKQRRSNISMLWKDDQWIKFERVCNEEIHTSLSRHFHATQDLEHALTGALQILNSVR